MDDYVTEMYTYFRLRILYFWDSSISFEGRHRRGGDRTQNLSRAKQITSTLFCFIVLEVVFLYTPEYDTTSKWAQFAMNNYFLRTRTVPIDIRTCETYLLLFLYYHLLMPMRDIYYKYISVIEGEFGGLKFVKKKILVWGWCGVRQRVWWVRGGV